MKGIRLKTNYLINPIGIDIKSPEFTWNCEGGKNQTAYHVVCRDEKNTVLWDTGKVLSNAMRVTYSGEILKSRTRVTWTLQLWDETDKAGEVSEAFFEMRLLESNDWKAEWITGKYTVDKKKRYPADCFKKCFCVPEGKTVEKARAYMTACGVYEGKLNGNKIGRFFLAPGITDYRKRVQYQTVDITELVQTGENKLTFMLADGWYRGSVGAWAMKNYYGSETKLLAQLEIFIQTELLKSFVAVKLLNGQMKAQSDLQITKTVKFMMHGWSGDAQIFVNTASYMVNYAPFALKYENDLCDWQDKRGAFPQIAPEGGTDSYMRTMNGSVGWADAGVLIPYRLWKKYNDISIIEKYYDSMKKYAEFMISRTGKFQLLIFLMLWV